jgi:hypothetical protein
MTGQQLAFLNIQTLVKIREARRGKGENAGEKNLDPRMGKSFRI